MKSSVCGVCQIKRDADTILPRSIGLIGADDDDLRYCCPFGNVAVQWNGTVLWCIGRTSYASDKQQGERGPNG